MPRSVVLVFAVTAATVLGCRSISPESPAPPQVSTAASTAPRVTASPTPSERPFSTSTPPPTLACAPMLDATPFRTHLPFARQAAAAVDYLNAGGRVEALRAALTCWGSIGNAPPGDFPYGGVEEVDLSADGTPEIVIAMGDPDAKTRFPPGRVLILERSRSSYAIRFDSDKLEKFDDAPALLPFADRNGDGTVDLAYTAHYLGASQASLTIVVVGWRPGSANFETLLTATEIFGELTIEARPDGTSTFTLSGGVKNQTQGPTRDHRVTYAWDGRAFAQVSDVPIDPRDRWHDLWVVYDADQAAKAGRYDEAIEGYQYLQQRAPSTGSEALAADLRTYAAFRLMLTYLAKGDTAAAEAIAPTFSSVAARQATPGTALAFGATFVAAYRGDAKLASACAAAIGNGEALRPPPLTGLWGDDFRALVRSRPFYYKPKDFCPFG